jgi:O-antigen/teichoic acid export membrane protein
VSAVSSQESTTTVSEPPTPVQDPGFSLQRILPWITKGGLAIVDYGLISGSNFLLGVLLARWLAPDEYGAYALAFSIFILVAFLYQALLLEPLSVFSGTAYRDNIRGYLKATVWLHWSLSFVVCFLLGATAVVARVWWHSAASAAAFTGLTIATPFILIHALGRRSFYLKLSPAPAAFGSIFYCVLVTVTVFLVYRWGWLTSFTAYLVMGLAALVSGVIMFFQLNAKLEPARGQPRLREAWGKHWEYGKWAFATCVVGWIPNYVYIPLVSSFSGMTAAGELRAVMNFAAPLLQTFAALSMLILPYAARVQSQEGRHAASVLSRKLTLLFVGGGIAYWAVLIPLRHQVFHFVYAGKYTESSYLVPLFALESMLWSAALGPAILLRAMESPRSLFFANGAASVIAIIFGIPATRYFGLRGVVWSIVLANLLYMIVAFVLASRKLATLQAGAVNFEVPLPADGGVY